MNIRPAGLMKYFFRSVLFEKAQRTGDCGLTGRSDRKGPDLPRVEVNKIQEVWLRKHGHSPVSTGCVPPILRQTPWEYGGISCVVFLVSTKRSSVETAWHLTVRSFRMIFSADDEALLAQGEEDKAKSTEKGR